MKSVFSGIILLVALFACHLSSIWAHPESSLLATASGDGLHHRPSGCAGLDCSSQPVVADVGRKRSVIPTKAPPSIPQAVVQQKAGTGLSRLSAMFAGSSKANATPGTRTRRPHQTHQD